MGVRPDQTVRHRPGPVPGDLALRRGRLRGPAGRMVPRDLPAVAGRALSEGIGGPRRAVPGHSRAERHVPSGARHPPDAAGTRDRGAAAVPGRRVDRHGVAGHHGGRGPKRRGRRHGGAPGAGTNTRPGGGGGMTAPTRAAARSLPAGLVRTRPMISAALAEAVGRLPELLRLPVAYHLGMAEPDGRATTRNGGKANRPAGEPLSARAGGGGAGGAPAWGGGAEPGPT